jgi:uncharacterized protein (DUF952 family)
MIFHITNTELWEHALSHKVYKHPSLKTEGFVHCSTAAQLPQTIERHFATAKEIVILGIVEKRVKNILKWEMSADSEIPFPHLYGNIPIEAFETQEFWWRNEKGEWEKD